MEPKEVAASYDQIAERFSASSLGKYGIAQVERAISFTPGSGFALDVGCGTGRLSRVLVDRGFDTVGVDLSDKMLALAHEQYPDISFIKADICEWELPQKYDLVLAWDSTWHVPLAWQERVMRKLCDGLLPGGVFAFTTGGIDKPEEKHDAAMGPPMYHCTLGIPSILKLLAACDCVCRHLEYDQPLEKHLYIIAQKAGK